MILRNTSGTLPAARPATVLGEKPALTVPARPAPPSTRDGPAGPLLSPVRARTNASRRPGRYAVLPTLRAESATGGFEPQEPYREWPRADVTTLVSDRGSAPSANQIHVRANISSRVAETSCAVFADTAPSIRTNRCRSTARSWSSATCPRLP
jgi:hypothetical protein